MKKLLLIGFSVVGLALSAVAGINSSIKEIDTVQAGVRCVFCNGTGFQPGTNFRCGPCGGKGWK